MDMSFGHKDNTMWPLAAIWKTNVKIAETFQGIDFSHLIFLHAGIDL